MTFGDFVVSHPIAPKDKESNDPMTESKPFWLSKTFWVGLLGLIAGLLGVANADEWIAQYPEVAGWIASAFSFVMIVLRAISSTAISFAAGNTTTSSSGRRYKSPDK